MSQTVGVRYAVTTPAPAQRPGWGRVVAIVIGAFVLAGIVAGWGWQQYAPLALYRVGEDGATLDEVQMTRVFGPDGTFVSAGFVAAVVVGGALFFWLRDRGPWAVAAVVLGSAAGSGVAWSFGTLLGHEPLDPRLAAANTGDLVPAPLELHSWTALGAWPVGAALVVALIATMRWRHEPAADNKPESVRGRHTRTQPVEQQPTESHHTS